jgi:hypothetical protein
VDYAQWPFSVAELERPDAGVERLFRKLFKAPPPDFPRHFVVNCATAEGPRLAAYMHFTRHEPGVYLLGGLGIDVSVYRAIGAAARAEVARHDSLSRWFLREAITALGPKRAVFAYTGDTRSRRDAVAIGMVPVGRYLFVQWHDEPEAARNALVLRVAALGAF